MNNLTFRYGPGGALLCDEEIEGITQRLDDQAAGYYGGRYMVGESMTVGAATRIAELLGGSIAIASEKSFGS